MGEPVGIGVGSKDTQKYVGNLHVSTYARKSGDAFRRQHEVTDHVGVFEGVLVGICDGNAVGSVGDTVGL